MTVGGGGCCKSAVSLTECTLFLWGVENLNWLVRESSQVQIRIRIQTKIQIQIRSAPGFSEGFRFSTGEHIMVTGQRELLTVRCKYRYWNIYTYKYKYEAHLLEILNWRAHYGIGWSERVALSVGSTDCGQGGGRLEHCVWRVVVQCLHNGTHAGTIAHTSAQLCDRFWSRRVKTCIDIFIKGENM